ncbi:MAG: pectate lyase [Alistipes sp.]|nr:pectate lyase [Alistipes sp.]
MNRILYGIAGAVALLLTACGGGGGDDFTPEKLATPKPAVTLNGAVAQFNWPPVPSAKAYFYELTCEEMSKGSGSLAVNSFSTKLDAHKSYQFRVKAQAERGSAYQDSDWSEFVAVTYEPSEEPEEPQDPTPTTDLGLPEHEQDGVIRAFPGAEGGGMYTTGGRGGKVIHVTNLNDSGTGSLRAAINTSGKRIIVFDVAGTITLKSDLEIGYGDLTIAGQTAPGDGICIKGGTVQIKASNLIIRFVRFRMGDESSFVSDGSDASWGRYYQDIILDHNSYSWSIDEVASFYGNKNFTMQWCTIGEGLCNSKHSKKSHGYGGIWGGKNASFHHNLLIHNNSRNPRFCHPQVYGNQLSTHRGNVDYRNNVVYNWGDNSSYGGEDLHINMVGNYYKPGPASQPRKYFLDANGYYSSGSTQYKYPRLYLEDNYHAGSYATALNSDNWQGIYWHDQGDATKHAAGDVSGAKLSAPLPIKKDDVTTCYTTTHTAADAYARALDYAGASLKRDAVDKRYMDDARNGKATCMSGSNGSKNGLIDSQNDAGGWPTLTASSEEIERATKDSDGDHIPDYYEALLGLDKTKADATAKTLDPQGLYTNFEIYLHYLVKDITAGQTAGGTYKKLE